MPYAFNGCGTRFYGERDRAEDGSYVTTEWITLFYLPLVPIRSYRVLPVGKGTNILIHSSQNYQSLRVPLCWDQVRSVYLVVVPILLVILYFAGPSVKSWVMNEYLASHSAQSSLQPEPVPSQPPEADLPLNPRSAALACGKVLKLDNEAAFVGLDLMNRLSQLVASSGYTDEEFKDMSSPKEVEEQAFKAYSFAYVMWDKTEKASRADFDKMMITSFRSVDMSTLSPDDRARLDTYLRKWKTMMLKAFDLGRHDAKTSPCTVPTIGAQQMGASSNR